MGLYRIEREDQKPQDLESLFLDRNIHAFLYHKYISKCKYMSKIPDFANTERKGRDHLYLDKVNLFSRVAGTYYVGLTQLLIFPQSRGYTGAAHGSMQLTVLFDNLSCV